MPFDNDDERYDTAVGRSDESSCGQPQSHGKLDTAGKAIRAVTAIVVFGIPLVTGTAAVLGYGFYRAYKRLTRQS